MNFKNYLKLQQRIKIESEDDLEVGGVKLPVQMVFIFCNNFYPEIYVGYLVVCASVLLYFTIVYAYFILH